MKATTKAPTMKDVAAEAGVALGTVSKVFNNLPVGDEYRQKVEAAAKKLGYSVNQYARGLRSSKTNTIALVLPGINHPFYSEFADHCCNILHSKGYRMLIATTSYNHQMEQECINMVQQNKVDGIIAITYNPALEVSDELPFIIIDRKIDAKVPCVSSDNFAGGQLAAQKLAENGCQHLLFLGNSSKVPGEADKRLLGFERYCIQNNLTYDILHTYDGEGVTEILNFVSDFSKDGTSKYDGIFCNTDALAVQVIDILKEHHIRIPEDIQIIGYDGVKKFGSGDYFCSTICQPLFDMANTAIHLLLEDDMASSPSLICLPIRYQEGGTTISRDTIPKK